MEALNEYAAIIQALATVGIIIVTTGLLCATTKMAIASKETSEATKLLADENRRLREDAKKPLILAKLKPMAEHGENVANLVIKAPICARSAWKHRPSRPPGSYPMQRRTLPTGSPFPLPAHPDHADIDMTQGVREQSADGGSA